MLYLDYDGVLHPSEVYLIDGEPKLQLYNDQDLTLFCWAPILQSILDDLDPAGRVRIVLSTSWVRVLGYERALASLPEGLRQRVIGRVRINLLNEFPRGVTVADDAAHREIEHWLAIDDDAWGWPVEHRHRLIHTSGGEGIGCSKAQDDLRKKLEYWMGRT